MKDGTSGEKKKLLGAWWMKIVDKLAKTLPMVSKCMFKQCYDKVDKMWRTYNKMQQTY
jgi:hypothetical protein